MSKQGIFKSYQLIIDKIARRPGITFRELEEFLHDEGFEVSYRTLQRYIEQIRNEFSIDIRYDAHTKGYSISELSGPDMDLFLRLLSINDTAGVLMDSIKSGRTTLNYVQMDSSGIFRGSEYFKLILDAIKKQRKLQLTHHSYESRDEKSYHLEPYLLKEYRGRWYVWGKVEGRKEFRTFGLDRIVKLSVVAKKFERDKKVNAEKVFSDTVGIYFTGEAPKEILLRFTAKMAKYVDQLPLHSSQTRLDTNEKGVTFRYFLSINPEWKSIILSYANDVKVVAPGSLAREIADLHKKAAKQY
jgi:predicted DNA-binding transcriptional regulator YafY